jgi:starch-binding outer membrane protein, SusD/RagB family
MKSTVPTLFIAVVFASLTSCEEFLEKNNYDTLNESLFYKTVKDAEAAVAGAYVPFRSNGQYKNRFYWLNSMCTDMSWPGGNNDNREYHEFYDYNIKSDNPALSAMWQESWPSVMRANTIIDRIAGTDIDVNVKNRILGEAHFIRALAYFNLVRIYGKIPIILGVQNPSEMYVSRDEVVDVYKLIVSDLKFAEANLSDNYPEHMVYKATKGAARTVLALVYLTRGNKGVSESVPCWDSAAFWADKIIQSGRYSLWQDNDPEVLESVFISNGYHANFRTENGKESIFEIQYSDIRGTDYADIAQSISEKDACRPCGYSNWGRGGNFPRVNFVNGWRRDAPGDVRFDVAIMAHGDTVWLPGGNTLTGLDYYVHDSANVTVGTNITGYMVEKWQYGNTRGRESSPQNMAIFRYAEVLLIMAEALNEMGRTGEAYQYINQIRQRAHLPDLSGLSQEEFRDAVLLERKYELAYEFNRWFDLSRTGKLIDVLYEDRGVVLTENNLILPVPLSELTINPNLGPQNAGY